MKNKILVFFLAFFLAFFCVSAWAQSSEKLTEIISSETVTVGQIAYLAGTCGQGLDENEDYDTALAFLKDKGIVSNALEAQDEATASIAANIFMKNAGISGGLFYRIFGCDRYAFKELKNIGLIPQTVDPDMKISGRDAISILNDTLDYAKD